MLDARVFHKTGTDSVASILQDGLRCGKQGRHSLEDHARRANEVLDELRPGALRRRGVDRHRCAYGYLWIDGRIADVDSGRFVAQDEWDVGDGYTTLQLVVDPDTAFISDLEAYDVLAKHIDAGEDDVRALAARYWERLVALPDLCAHYRLADDLPARLERIEVLITADVPSADIHPA
jgi:hypothetical protein